VRETDPVTASSTPSTRIVDVAALDLDDLPLEPGSTVAGTPRAGLATLHELGEVEIGVWELTEGTVTDTEADEVFVVVSGTGSVTFADGERIELAPGALVVMSGDVVA